MNINGVNTLWEEEMYSGGLVFVRAFKKIVTEGWRGLRKFYRYET